MTSPHIPSRRELDRQGYLDATRAAHTARLDAAALEAIATNVKPNPAYGHRTEQAADIMRRGYITMTMKLLDLAVEAEAEAANYAAHLGAA